MNEKGQGYIALQANGNEQCDALVIIRVHSFLPLWCLIEIIFAMLISNMN